MAIKNLPVVIKNIIATKHDWILWQRENNTKKECAARKKINKFSPRQHRNVWLHIKATTESVDASY